MALVGRTSRRAATGRRWLAAGIVVTLLVLLIDASLKSRSPGPAQTQSNDAWVDQVLPLISASNNEGAVITSFRNGKLTLTEAAAKKQLSNMAMQAQQTYQQVLKLKAPGGAATAAGLLSSCLLVRSQAAAAYAKAVAEVYASAPPPSTSGSPSTTSGSSTSSSGTTSGSGSATATETTPPTATETAFVTKKSTTTTTSTTIPSTTTTTTNPADDPAEQALLNAVTEAQLGDRAYQLFTSHLPNVGTKMPPSVWIPSMAPYQASTLGVFLAALRASTSTAPVHKLEILAVSTNPGPVGVLQDGTQVLPPEKVMTVTVVVANPGSADESNLVVEAKVVPSALGAPLYRTIDVQPGAAQSLQMTPLYPVIGDHVTLTIIVSPPRGSGTTGVSVVMPLEMAQPGSTPTSTSTTTPAGGNANTNNPAISIATTTTTAPSKR